MKGWFLRASHACVCVVLLAACGGEEAAETGSNVVASCTDLAKEGCPPGTSARLDADAVAECGASASGSVTFTDQSGELSGQCKSEGDCSFACVPPAACCGGEEWTDTSYKCDLPCAGVDTCSCEDRCGAIQDGDCDVDCGSCPVGSVCSDEGICEAGCAEGAQLCAGACCGAGEVCYLNLCCDRVTNCTGKECGTDNCGGICESQLSIPGCAPNETCENGVCSQTCLLGDVRCFTSGGQQKVQECQQPVLEDGTVLALGWYVIETCLGDAPNCLLSNLGATCVKCTQDDHCLPEQTCDADGLCAGECPPQCEGLECGGDQCGGSCGSCDEVTEACVDYQCKNIEGSEPECDNKECGDDGIGGECGQCGVDQVCDPEGKCCSTDCGTKQCGTNECGGSCGECEGDTACNDAFVCVCVPNCTDAVCGSDGCNGLCGECASPTAPDCVDGQCKCTPNCEDKECGSDGCGGTCGGCGASEVCNNGQCASDCAPSCTGKVCGPDGCEGVCGTCGGSEVCGSAGQCTGACVPECASDTDNPCGPDGCGASCGTCTSGQLCEPSTEGNVCVDPPAPCGSVNLIEENSGGAYIRMDVDYNEETTPHDNYALGVWVKGESGDSVTTNRTVIESDTGLKILFKGTGGGTAASFTATFPNAKGKGSDPYSFYKSSIPGYGNFWKSPPSGGPQWVLMGFVKQGETVHWCASNTAGDSQLGETAISDDGKSMYLDQLVGDGTTDNKGEATRIGQQLSNGSPLRTYVGGVRIYAIGAGGLGESPCKLLWYAMVAEPDNSESSGWTSLRSWSLNTFFPNAAFKEHNFPDGNGQDLQLMGEWKESAHFEEGTCPVAYASPNGQF